MNREKTLIKNTFLLYIMTAAKLILPLITLPYLTRVLTTDGYGVVVYVKSCMTYVQLVIDFGFILSATKDVIDIVKIHQDDEMERKKNLGRCVGDVYAAKFILAFMSMLFIAGLTLFVPLLQDNLLFLWLYLFSYVINIFLADFLFRGLEKMEMISIPFVIAKTISTVLTFVFVKSDATIINIAILEIVGNLAAVIFTSIYIKKMGIKVSFSRPYIWFKQLKESFTYFISNIATTAFGALNTVLVGIFLSTSDVAYWGVAMQLVSAVQQMYAPIFNSLYPYMIKSKSLATIKKILLIFMPIVTLGCLFCFVFAKLIIIIISGKEYIAAVDVFRALIPVMFISFPAMLYGWPVLGAIYKVKETTFSTVLAAVVQVGILALLAMTNTFTLINLAIARFISELSMFVSRYYFYRKNIHEFIQ